MKRFQRLLFFTVIGGLILGLTAVLTQAAPADMTGSATAAQPQRDYSQGIAFLTGPNEGAPAEIALDYLSAHRAEYGLTTADIADYVITDQYTDQYNGVTHIYLRQRYQGIEVHGGVINVNVAADGSVINLGSHFVSDAASQVNRTAPVLSSLEAVQTAALRLGLSVTEGIDTIEAKGGVDQRILFSGGGFSLDPIPVHLVYEPFAGQLRLAWRMVIHVPNGTDWWDMRIDAATGAVLGQDNWYVNDVWDDGGQTAAALPAGDGPTSTASVSESGRNSPDSYRVFPMPYVSPIDPGATHVVVTNPADPTASPYGWHDTNGSAGAEFTDTRGNNVSAQEDANANNSGGFRPEGGATLDFDYAWNAAEGPTGGTNQEAAIVNLFYWNNIIHDVLYHYGFTEAAGNFQENNYGNGGAQGDPVQADAQDGSGTNNANFGTPSDGNDPRMQMYIWTYTTPNRDSDMESGIIMHEYGHGVSNRLTGGPTNVNCLNNGEQMGEGWSDWLALVITAKATDTGTTERGMGAYVLGQPYDGPGIRTFPYTTDMSVNPHTYDDIKTTGGQPHAVGEKWAVITWEVFWALIDEHGFDADMYHGTGGNNIALQLIIDGMKLQPCSPGFVDGRDAILLADQINNGGANQCLLWAAFAKRGLGASAVQGSSSSVTDNSEAFDIPESCRFLSVTTAPIQNICVGDVATYDISLGEAYTAPVTMSVVGEPAGTTAAFTPNPVNTIPGVTQLAVSNTAGATPGQYFLDITGTGVITSSDLQVELNVFDSIPISPTLTAPADGATNVDTQPLFTWTADAPGTTYSIEIATDEFFANVVNSASGLTDASYTPAVALDTNTNHYWRVWADNTCGSGGYSEVRSFMTVPAPGDCTLGAQAIQIAEEDFESGPGGWVVTGGQNNTWALSGARPHSGTTAFHAEDLSIVSDQYLYSPEYVLPSAGFAPITLQFWNYQAIEDRSGGCYDGGIVEISTDGGANWDQIDGGDLLTDPYDGLVSTGFSNPLGGKNAWCGDPQDWLESIVDLNAFAGQTVQFRFRLGTDTVVSREGWYVDDVVIQACVSADYAASLGPNGNELFGFPGDVVTHTFALQNVGLQNDSYNLSLSGSTWPTSLITSSPVAVNSGSSAVVQVTVTTPGTPFLSDSFTLTATSVNSPTVSTAATAMTTTDVDVAMSGSGVTEGQAAVNHVVTYVLTVTNDGNWPDTYTVSYSGNAWGTALETTSVGPLNPGQSDTVEVYVTVGGDGAYNDDVTITFTSTLDNSVTMTMDLTTWRVFRATLPVVLRP